MMWDLITNIILGAAIAVLGLFVCLGLYQWFTRKSFKKIDPGLRWATVPIVLMGITYVVFDKVFIWNTRPDGSGEPSFPSSHVMLVATVFFLTAIILPKYISQQSTRILLDLAMFALLTLVCVGRVLANKHWVSDVEGALMDTVKKLSHHLEQKLGARILWKVVGTDVPHAHVHLMPLDPTWTYGKTLDLTPDEFAQIRTDLEYHDQ